jgi:hypothetical protein
MATLSNKIMLKLCSDFSCKICDYTTGKKSSYANHLLSAKHQTATNGNKIMLGLCSAFICDYCNKSYKNRTGLWRHKKACNVQIINNGKNEILSSQISPELIINVLQQNKELQQLLIEQNKTILELSKTSNNINTNISHINSHNKTFNLQFFLNETCKDAMNMSDFIDSMKLQLTDLESVGKLGFVDGISNIIINNLIALDVEKRPVHCSDSKRETMYIKDKDKWEKEDDELNKMKQIIRQVRDKNISLINTWRDLYPECVLSNSKKTELFNKICMESFGGDQGTKQQREEKIISKIAKEIVIDKSEYT